LTDPTVRVPERPDGPEACTRTSRPASGSVSPDRFLAPCAWWLETGPSLGSPPFKSAPGGRLVVQSDVHPADLEGGAQATCRQLAGERTATTRNTQPPPAMRSGHAEHAIRRQLRASQDAEPDPGRAATGMLASWLRRAHRGPSASATGVVGSGRRGSVARERMAGSGPGGRRAFLTNRKPSQHRRK